MFKQRDGHEIELAVNKMKLNQWEKAQLFECAFLRKKVLNYNVERKVRHFFKLHRIECIPYARSSEMLWRKSKKMRWKNNEWHRKREMKRAKKTE